MSEHQYECDVNGICNITATTSYSFDDTSQSHGFCIFVLPYTSSSLPLFSLIVFFFSLIIQRLTRVLSAIAERENMESESMDLLHKFRKQTVRRLQHLQDIKKVTLLFSYAVLLMIIRPQITLLSSVAFICQSLISFKNEVLLFDTSFLI